MNYFESYTESDFFTITCKKCSKPVEINKKRFTSTCSNCEADYNGQGELLASREQWGEETGEHWTYCY